MNENMQHTDDSNVNSPMKHRSNDGKESRYNVDVNVDIGGKPNLDQHKHEHQVIEILSSDDENDSIQSSTSNKCNIVNEDEPPSKKLKQNERKETAKPKTRKTLSHQNSAYVQHLAEMCHDILYDERWRTIQDRNQLFQAESGDDLALLHSFGELFIDGQSDKGEDQQPSIDQYSQKLSDSDNARIMHLYSRLFHRKGPWFQLTDIFMKYYHRDYIRRQIYEINISQNQKHSTNMDDPPIESLQNKSNSDELVTWEWIENCLRDCLNDIYCLFEKGLIRGFDSQEECGTIVGQTNSLCTLKEKESLLRKLGWRKTKNSAQVTKTKSNTSETKKKSIRENEILKQMHSQKTIFSQQLPVENHLKNILLESLASKLLDEVEKKTVVKDNASTDASGKSVLDIISTVKAIWQEINVSKNTDLNLLMCIRLKEEPLKALRRCARLYLIAGNGSGTMRSDGTNAWLTIYEGSTDENKDKNALYDARTYAGDICSIPDPPHATDWHKVGFNGLNHRFGLMSCHYICNHRRIPVNDITQHFEESTKDNLHINIFKDITCFHLWELCIEFRNMADYLIEWNRLILYVHRNRSKNASDVDSADIDAPMQRCPQMNNSLDFLSRKGRKEIIQKLLYHSYLECVENIHEQVEQSIISLVGNGKNGDGFITDAERIICCMGLICQYVLLHIISNISHEEMYQLIKRPWLRHLSYVCSMSYLIWDCVEIVEKRGHHNIALDMLETILYGEVRKGQKFQSGGRNGVMQGFMQVLLSRRVRGKAFERLFLDRKHVMNKSIASDSKASKNSKMKGKRQYDDYLKCTMKDMASVSSVPFSFLRKIARRLKVSMSRLLDEIWNTELLELGIILQRPNMREWTPFFDVSTANALVQDFNKNVPGKRCRYIGNEDSGNTFRSLNVEELAIEEYNAGKLPDDSSSSLHGGGWQGWHSEGLHIRALFRILCRDPILCHDFHHQSSWISTQLSFEQLSVFVTPYQTSPLDLHVGHCLLQTSEVPVPVRGFYERRKRQIEFFLEKLSSLTSQELSSLVYESIIKRKKAINDLGKRWDKDDLLIRDMKELRTLSLLAASIGGKLLSTMFRCLCYDYRQYSGGMPDLTLVRAGWNENEMGKFTQWDEWIGEGFSKQNQNSKDLLFDRDDEFLGGCLNDRKSTRRDKQPFSSDTKEITEIAEPECLLLSHNEQSVTLQALFVEVKSANDTLDERQEDWLNIIGGSGDARVCKFVSSNKGKR